MSHKSYRILAMTVALLLAGNGLPVHAQQCIPDLSGFRVGTKAPGGDGLVHITYQFVDGSGNSSAPTQAVRTAFESAINDWNSKSGTTGVVFEPAPPGNAGDLQFMPEANTSDPCASYSPVTERVYYNASGFQEAAQARPIFAAEIVKH